jgi:hypothetical protein
MRGSCLTVPFDLDLALFHLLEKLGVTDDSSRISHFPACLVQTGNDADNGALCNVSQ